MKSCAVFLYPQLCSKVFKSSLLHNVSIIYVSVLLCSKVVALSMFRGICEAVYCMHSAKPHPLAHRDIKTTNVLLMDDLRPLLMDLGEYTF